VSARLLALQDYKFLGSILFRIFLVSLSTAVQAVAALRNHRDKILWISDASNKCDREDHSRKINRLFGRSPCQNCCASETEIDAKRPDSVEPTILKYLAQPVVGGDVPNRHTVSMRTVSRCNSATTLQVRDVVIGFRCLNHPPLASSLLRVGSLGYNDPKKQRGIRKEHP